MARPKRVLTATEIKEGWTRKHDSGCNCELCHVHCRIKLMQDAIFPPLISRLKGILSRKGY